jgi:regulatory protein
MSDDRPRRRQKRKLSPLDTTGLERLALGYVARFATSAAKFEAYLARKLRERGWDGDSKPDLAALVRHYVDLGYVDDAAFARARSGGLLRRGYGPRRVAQALGAAGIAEQVRAEVRAGEGAERRAALTMARKRGFGPFARQAESGRPDRAARDKQIAAMLRAGHPLDSARELVDAASVEAAEVWAAEAQDEEQA